MDTLILAIRVRVRRLAAAARISDRLATDDREARDAAIEQAAADGFSVREIAGDAQMSPSRIQQILIRRAAARQTSGNGP